MTQRSKSWPDGCMNSISKSKPKTKTDRKSPHYDVGGIAVIDVIKAKLTPWEYRGFLKGNLIKYACRIGHKDNDSRDVEKAIFYGNWLSRELNK